MTLSVVEEGWDAHNLTVNATSKYSPRETCHVPQLHFNLFTSCRVVRKSARCRACWRTCQISFAAERGMPVKFAGARCSEMRHVVGSAPKVFGADCSMVSACAATPRSTSEHHGMHLAVLDLTDVGCARLAPQGNQRGFLGLDCNLSRISRAIGQVKQLCSEAKGLHASVAASQNWKL